MKAKAYYTCIYDTYIYDAIFNFIFLFICAACQSPPKGSLSLWIVHIASKHTWIFWGIPIFIIYTYINLFIQFFQLAKALRKGPYQTNLLLAGYDDNEGMYVYVCMYVCVCLCICMYVYTCIDMYEYLLCISYWQDTMIMKVCICVCTCVCLCIFVYLYLYLNMYMRTSVCICLYMYMYFCIYIHIHMYLLLAGYDDDEGMYWYTSMCIWM